MSAGRKILLPYLLFAIPCFVLILTTDKVNLHLSINALHRPALDTFFRYITVLGDGYMLYFILLLALVRKYWETLFLFTATALASLTTQIIKRSLSLPRPARVFEGLEELYFVEGVKVHHHHSFPSGHSTTAFALFLGLALLFPKWRWPLVGLAVLVAFSRVYLSQHFTVDILAGSIIGLVFVLLAFPMWSKWKDKRSWLRGNLMKREA
jgi:membrane-associated phospholipid phosphatase